MNKIRKSFALCASVATTFIHGSAGKIYKSYILRTAAITRTPSTRSLTVHVGHKISTQDLSKRRLWSAGTRALHKISARSCEMILWDDHQHFTRSFGSRSVSYCMCYILLRKNGQGVTRSCLCCTCRAKLTFTSHAFPHGITHLRCATPGEPRSLQVDPSNPCHAKREHSCCGNAQSMQSRAVEPHWPLRPHPAYTSRIPLTATTLFGETFWGCEMGLTMDIS